MTASSMSVDRGQFYRFAPHIRQRLQTADLRALPSYCISQIRLGILRAHNLLLQDILLHFWPGLLEALSCSPVQSPGFPSSVFSLSQLFEGALLDYGILLIYLRFQAFDIL